MCSSLSRSIICNTKMLITIAADDILIFVYFLEKIRLDISCEWSDQQPIHSKCRLIFSEKINKYGAVRSADAVL